MFLRTGAIFEGTQTMTDNKTKRLPQIPKSEIALANMGLGEVAYVRKVSAIEVEHMIGQKIATDPTTPLYCLYLADGTPVSVSDSREAALANAFEHDLAAINPN
jgi:hypothetical protein